MSEQRAIANYEQDGASIQADGWTPVSITVEGCAPGLTPSITVEYERIIAVDEYVRIFDEYGREVDYGRKTKTERKQVTWS